MKATQPGVLARLFRPDRSYPHIDNAGQSDRVKVICRQARVKKKKDVQIPAAAERNTRSVTAADVRQLLAFEALLEAGLSVSPPS